MCIVLSQLCSFFLVLHPSLCNVSDAKCGTSDMVTNVESSAIALVNQLHLGAKRSSPCSLFSGTSLKTINKSNICTNNGFIYINISFILTNISFIYTFLRGGANFLPRCYRFRIPENNVNDKGWYKRTASFCRSEPVLYSSV